MNKTIKWVLIAAGLAVGAAVLKEASKANKEVDARIEVRNACMRQAQKNPNLPADKAKLICDCTVDRAEKAVGRDAFRRFANDAKKATEADKKALADTIGVCVDEHMPNR